MSLRDTLVALLAQAEAVSPPTVDESAFSTAAVVILAIYLVALLTLGIVGWRRSVSSEEDYYLAGRRQGWLVSSLTILATFFSSFALLGAPGMVYREGVAFALFALNVPVGAAVVYVVGSRVSRLGRRRGHVTQADLFSEHYGSPVAIRLLVAAVGFLYAVPYIVMQLNAGGIISTILFPNAERAFQIGTNALAVVTVLYILIGGMRSVAWTDVIQGVLLCLGMFLAGAAAIGALGGIGGFFDRVAELPRESLRLPGTTGQWTPTKLFTIITIAAVGSMIQPAQWMRYYAADSSRSLRRSALVFATVLPIGYLFGVLLVGLGGQALYPLLDAAGEFRLDEAGKILPHPAVGPGSGDFDRIVVVVLRDHLPALVGSTLGVTLCALVSVAILAASMSTADSNLHALSAIFTRDVYDRFVRPRASERERTLVGRATIVLATLAALGVLALQGSSEHFNPVRLIAELGFVAIAFASQLIPMTVDVLWIRRGTSRGAVAGLLVGLGVVLLFTPLFGALLGSDGSATLDTLSAIDRTVDKGAFALLFNGVVFALVSALDRRSGVAAGKSSEA